MVFYETPPAPLRNALDANAVGAFLDWITLTLGPYPYGDEIRVAGGPTVWLGFEHPANIVLRDDLPSLALSYADGTMHVLMHEVVHQWAGDRTTLAATADFVWKEAISEYLAYVFEDEQGGAGDADATRAYWDAASQQASYFPRPLDEPTPPVESFYGSVYGPGPMVLFVQLEPWLGRVGVLDAIQLFLADPGARSVSDLQAALEQVAGLDLAAYFDAWVYGTGAPSWPTFTVTTTQVGDQLTVTATFADGQARGCALEIDVHGATESATAIVDFGSAPQNASAQVTVTLSEPLVSYDVDPRHRVIDGNSVAAAATKVWIF
jgi:aminopeptidase N